MVMPGDMEGSFAPACRERERKRQVAAQKAARKALRDAARYGVTTKNGKTSRSR
jgi:hypothetical protein